MTDPRNPLIAGVTNDASNTLDSLLPTSYALNQILSGKVLASNVDANTLTACGKYQFNATTTNVPAGMIGLSGFITVTHERPTPPSNDNFGQAQTISFTPTVIHQVITCNDPTKGMWFRTYASSAWSDWKTVYNDTALTTAVTTLQSNLSAEITNRTNADIAIFQPSAVSTDANFDNYTTPGLYFIHATAVSGNPYVAAGTEFWAFLRVWKCSGVEISQLLTIDPAGTIFYRGSNSGGWTSWQRVATKADLDAETTARTSAINSIVAVPVGCVIAFASDSATIPTGFILCNGAAFSRTTYANMFGSIGTLYGAGDGSTTFNVPDFRGRFLRGYLSGTSAAIGTAQESQNLSHRHYVTGLVYWGTKADTGSGSSVMNGSSTEYPTDYSGGTEARPINYAIQWLIRY